MGLSYHWKEKRSWNINKRHVFCTPMDWKSGGGFHIDEKASS